MDHNEACKIAGEILGSNGSLASRYVDTLQALGLLKFDEPAPADKRAPSSTEVITNTLRQSKPRALGPFDFYGLALDIEIALIDGGYEIVRKKPRPEADDDDVAKVIAKEPFLSLNDPMQFPREQHPDPAWPGFSRAVLGGRVAQMVVAAIKRSGFKIMRA